MASLLGVRGRATTLIRPLLRALLLCAFTVPGAKAQGGAAQAPADSSTLDALVRVAVETHPSVRAAAGRLQAARAQARRSLLPVRIQVLEHRLNGAYDEGKPDEDQRDHDARGSERHLQPH